MTEKIDIADAVRTIIADHIGVEIEKVVDTAKLRDDLGADSLDEVELTIALEMELDIEITDDETFDFETATVADVIKLVQGKVK